MRSALIILAFTLFLFGCQKSNKESVVWIASAPAGKAYVQINHTDTTVLPNGRFITPAGKTVITAPHPYGLTLSPDGNTAITANSGTSPISITIIRNLLSENPEVQQIPPGPKSDKGILASVFMGLAVSPDNQTVYASGGQENKIYLFDLPTGRPKVK